MNVSLHAGLPADIFEYQKIDIFKALEYLENFGIFYDNLA
jgi:hypothetical protein